MNSESAIAPCIVCGGTDFRTGPCDRLSNTGRLPCCKHCGSLERHRIIRRIAGLFPARLLAGKRALQFSTDDSLDPAPFAEFTVSVYGGKNSLDIQAIDLPDGSYDWVISNHVVNFIPDDLSALREMNRVAGQDGIVLLTVGGTTHQYGTQTFDKPTGPHQAFRIYGSNFAERITEALPEVHVLELVATDPSTATLDSVYLYSWNRQHLRDIASATAPSNIHARITSGGGHAADQMQENLPDGTWQALEKELSEWRSIGRSPRLWLRDDDATVPHPLLDQLWAVCAEAKVPVLFAAIPSLFSPALAEWAKDKQGASFALHGFDHQDRAGGADEDGKNEFPPSASPEHSLRKIAVGKHLMQQAFGERFAPVLVPPWGNCDPLVRQLLPDLGLRGYSGAYKRAHAVEDGLHVANVHLQVPHSVGGQWQFEEKDTLSRLILQLRNSRAKGQEHDEPVGINTHHKAMFEPCFDFLRQLFAFSRAHGVRWLGADELFPA